MKYCLLVAIFLTQQPLAANAQTTDCWDFWDHSTVTLNYPGPEFVSVMVLPDGSGDPLTAARHPNGGVVDATITLTLNDCLDQPIVDFPAEDLWLETPDRGLVPCIGGTVADSNTNAQGVTTWTAPLRAGGYSEAGCYLFLSGMPMTDPALHLSFNSPDYNGDLTVNMTDVVIFAEDFFGPYQYRSDFFRDGTINLGDVTSMAQGLGRSCP